MGLPPDRPPRTEDLAWLEALAGRPSAELNPADAREAELLAEVIREVHDPKSVESASLMASIDDGDWADSEPRVSLSDLSASQERIAPSSASPADRSPPPDIRYQRAHPMAPTPRPDPEPTPGGFARLLKRLTGKGLL